MKEIGICGYGWVGKGQRELFPNAKIYDPLYKDSVDKCCINDCDISFIAVPTPLLESGKLDTSIVEEVVSWCKSPLIAIRSTVNPGTTDYLAEKYNRRIVFQPEYLGETPSHPLLDTKSRQFLVIGGEPKDRRELIDAYAGVYNANTTVRQLTNYEAEVVKLTENRAIGFKVMQMHELYLTCEAAGIDYYTIRDTVYGDDPRFNMWFTWIYDNLGFNSSKCLVKDIPAWAAWAESVGFDAELTKKLVEESNHYAAG